LNVLVKIKSRLICFESYGQVVFSKKSISFLEIIQSVSWIEDCKICCKNQTQVEKFRDI